MSWKDLALYIWGILRVRIEKAAASIIGRHKNKMPLHDHEMWEGGCMHGLR